ncbi:MAG: alanine racemase, partial [Bdellovibrionota bacterium]
MQRQMPGRPWQVRQTALEIDLALLKRNFQRLAKRAGSGAELLALMKSDAYGHSICEIARALESLPENSRLHGYGVANVEEGIELRRNGIQRPVYVLSGIQHYDGELHRCLETVGLTPVIGSIPVLRQLAATLQSFPGERAVHLKFNTGMNRLGIDATDVPLCLKILRENPGIKVHGLMSHFAAGEKPASAISRHQVKTFRHIVSLFRENGIEPRFVHMANSSGLASHLFPEGNLARVGLHLYGLDDKELFPVARWTAQVYQVRELAKGDGVGYGPHFRAKKKMKMAVLGVGYGDGYRRAYSNRAEVLLKGKRCRVIGAISMDLTAVDITHVPSVSARDRATLLGRDGRDRITAEELAAHGRSIPWEV